MDFLAVGIAGFVGAVTRALMARCIGTGPVGVFPVSTLVINLTGSFILGFFLTITLERLPIKPRLRLACGTGFLGAYTTFSTFALESVNLLRNERVLTALLYIGGTSVGCVLAAWAGASLSRVLPGLPKLPGEREDVEEAE